MINIIAEIYIIHREKYLKNIISIYINNIISIYINNIYKNIITLNNENKTVFIYIIFIYI